MLKLNRVTVRRQLHDVAEFIKLKNFEPWEGMRQDSKTVNFGFTFGASARTFANTSLDLKWTEERCDDYIAANKLGDLKDNIIARNPRDTPKMWKVLTCATDIRNKFFKTYTGLLKRIEREKKFAFDHGYVRSWHGPCRRIPELFLMDHNEAGRATGDDTLLYSRLVGNLQNVAANTSIQNFEACTVMPAIVELHEWLRTAGPGGAPMRSYIWNSVHDSIDLVIHREELDQVAVKVYEVCTRMYAVYQGLPQDVEMVVADLLKGDYYKGGKKYKFHKGVDDASDTNVKVSQGVRDKRPVDDIPVRGARKVVS